MTARVITTIALIVLPLIACADSPSPASIPSPVSTPSPASTASPNPTPIPTDRMASNLEAMRAADVALIDAFAAVNGAFINTAAANASFADELAGLNAYAAALHKALEAYRVALGIALNSYAGTVEGLVGIAAYDQLDFYETGLAAFAAMLIVRAAAYEAYDAAREVGYQGIEDAAYNATGERERIAALDAFTEDSADLLAASKAFITASEAVDMARDGLTDALNDITSERTPSRHGSDYVMAVLAALDAIDQGAVREAAREAAREAYTTSPKAAFDAAFNLMQEEYSSAIAAVPALTPTPTPTPIPIPSPTPALELGGLGITRSDIEVPFEKAGLNFLFGSYLDENDRVIDHSAGDAPDALVRLALFGPSDNLTKIEMTVGMSPDVNTGFYLALLLKRVFPEWADGMDWIIENLSRVRGGAKPTTSHGQLTIVLGYLSTVDWLVVTVTRQ